MILSNKTQFALLAVFDLAHNKDSGTITIADIAKRQNVSVSYLEQIFAKLKKASIVKSTRGPGGGYQITGVGLDMSIQDLIDIIGRFSPKYYHEKRERLVSASAKYSLAGLDGYIFRHLNKLSVKDAIKLI